MKLRIEYNMGKWIMWGYGGRLLYPFMLFAKSQEGVPDWIFRHEMEHVYQVRRNGWLRFHLIYLWELLRHGYKNNPFEVEARATESFELSDLERALKKS